MLYYADMLEVITLIVDIIGTTPIFSRMIETRERSHVRIALVWLNAWLLILLVLSAPFMEASPPTIPSYTSGFNVVLARRYEKE